MHGVLCESERNSEALSEKRPGGSHVAGLGGLASWWAERPSEWDHQAQTLESCWPWQEWGSMAWFHWELAGSFFIISHNRRRLLIFWFFSSYFHQCWDLLTTWEMLIQSGFILHNLQIMYKNTEENGLEFLFFNEFSIYTFH